MSGMPSLKCFVEEISSSDVALSRPGTYSNGKNGLQKTTEIPKNREAPMTLTIMRPARGKNKSMTPYSGFFLLKKVVMAIERT